MNLSTDDSSGTSVQRTAQEHDQRTATVSTSVIDNQTATTSHESDARLVHVEDHLLAEVHPNEKPTINGNEMVAENTRGSHSAIKSESHDEACKLIEGGVEANTNSLTITSRVADDESTTASFGTTLDDVDATTMDDEDASEIEQPRSSTDVLRKSSTAPQIDAEQLRCDPDFAVICSFINKFFTLMRMEPVSFCQLENMFTKLEDGRVSKELVDLHLKLLRRSIVKTVSNDSFEKCILKYLTSTGLLPSEKRQLETYGYVHMSILSKLKILRTLCELQLDHNARLKESIPSALRALDMRDVVTGVDKCGLAYYCQIDSVFDLRLYTTEQDDESGYSWTLVARDMSDLERLIAKLKSEDLGYVKNPNDKREFSKGFDGDAENVVNMVTRKGTYVDIFLDETAIKNMRTTMVKQKEERRNRRARLENIGEPPEEIGHDEEEKPLETEDSDRRVLPRRSASQRAQTNIRKCVTPKKNQEKKPNVAEVNLPVKDALVKRDSSTPVSDDSEGSADSSEGDGTASSDDEFKPKTQKKSGKRQRRRKKHIDDVEDDEDSGDEDEEEVRRRAEGDFACGSCKLSDNEDILLLCDNCDDAWHTTCLKPPLWFVPGGKWYCPKCEHGMLIECLTYVQEMLTIHQRKAAVEEKKRKAAADRFRREMEYIGVSLNNIIPSTLKQTAVESSSSSSSEDGQRRSKKKAVKKITPNVRRVPMHVQTVAEGRSRRSVKKVDYKFSEFDSVIKEACRMNESPPPDAMKEVARPQGGAGRGKDMANIIEAQKQQEEGAPRASAGVPPRRFPKHRRRLNDLNDLDESDSDSEEYKANESEEDAEDDDQSSDYVPSEAEFHLRRTGGGGRKAFARTQSDDDFIVSGSEDSYESTRRKKHNRKEKSRGRARWQSDSESGEDMEEDETYSDDSRGKKKVNRRRTVVSSDETSDEDDNTLAPDTGDDIVDGPKTRTGRPLRKAVAKSKTALVDNSDGEELDANEDTEIGLNEQEKPRRKRKIVSDSDSEDIFEPDEDMENDEDDDEDDGCASSDVAGSIVLGQSNMECNSGESYDSENDLDLKPKPKKPKLETEQDSTEVPIENIKDNGISSQPTKSAPIAVPSVSSRTNLNVQHAEMKPSISDLMPPTVQVASAPTSAATIKDPRASSIIQAPTPSPYLGPPATASRGKVLSTSVPVSIPTSMRPNAIAPDASVASYAARERKVNVAMAPVVPNPYATTSSVPQIHPYCAGQRGPLPYAVANPYVMYSPNASSFPSDPQSVGHAHIGYIPGVVPNPYGQQPNMAPTKGGNRDVRSL